MMGMKLRRILPLTSLVLVASLAFAGCTPSPSDDGSEPSVSSPAASPFVPGDVVDAATAEELDSGAMPGLRAYGMQDGTFVVVSESEMLPAEVLADMEARVQSVPVATAETAADVDGKLGDFVFSARKQTGKKVVVLTYSWYPMGIEANAPTVAKWTHIGEADGVPNPGDDIEEHSREEYRAILEAAQAKDPDIVIIEHG